MINIRCGGGGVAQQRKTQKAEARRIGASQKNKSFGLVHLNQKKIVP